MSRITNQRNGAGRTPGTGWRRAAMASAAFLAGGALCAQTMYSYVYDSGLPDAGVVADGNLTPWSDTRTVSGIPAGQTIDTVTVRVSISGGYNGDLYAYLSHGGVLVTLLNRPGVGSANITGYSDAGLDVTLDDAATGNVHSYQSFPGYSISSGATWQPDGRTVNPVTADPADFDAPGTQTLTGLLAGLDPNGDWTLVVADVVAGGGEPTVQSWELAITTTAIPETAGWAWAMAAGLLAWRAGRRLRQRHPVA